jgi:flagellar basal body-associated protein FliL
MFRKLKEQNPDWDVWVTLIVLIVIFLGALLLITTGMISG